MAAEKLRKKYHLIFSPEFIEKAYNLFFEEIRRKMSSVDLENLNEDNYKEVETMIYLKGLGTIYIDVDRNIEINNYKKEHKNETE